MTMTLQLFMGPGLWSRNTNFRLWLQLQSFWLGSRTIWSIEN